MIELPSSSATRLLLSHFNWDEQKLMDAYFGGEDNLLHKVGVKCCQQSNVAVSRLPKQVEEQCEICWSSREVWLSSIR